MNIAITQRRKIHTLAFFVILGGVWSIGAGCENGKQAMTQESNHSRQVERDSMVDTQIVGGGVTDPAVVAAMRRVPRHRFMPESQAEDAYGDFPLSIGYGQTISQPFIVAYMTQALKLKPDEKVLEIGTGSGYQAAILAELVSKVFTIEIVEPLAVSAKKTLAELGYDNVIVRSGDGYKGWPGEGPFDAIILTAAPNHIPEPLLEQLAIGGRLILPVGDYPQRLLFIRRTEEGYQETELLPVVFVPMTGEALTNPPATGP
ncbi:protein-L-isoaspartate(D-aspartate) O-methyltransferase [Candidatus Nitrospira allomarina]|uniref:Protein-L-isoaspartate O-methyltransferase n=1 Tax=Candidatus Nitrospira allomarina TaxID=3020900 RepID=A0AA96GKM4_9BACT|nr:protein-L-isoaspartate(D-aspartate) O-methyltransferase [Candidatus Nitrospira allomarina]WNM60064.1 protein-L-isoaspartate(D-aspartate) O-methyltransferase [Candidatus Nitrospira allomarina]